jgi:hypothetical protein
VTTPQEPQPPHPLHALTTSELTRYRRQLEHAIASQAPDAAAQERLCRKLALALAEQDSRAAIAADGRRDP